MAAMGAARGDASNGRHGGLPHWTRGLPHRTLDLPHGMCGTPHRTRCLTFRGTIHRLRSLIFTALAFVIVVPFLTGCADPANRELRVTLGGAQIPLELVESWLHDSQRPHYAVSRASPAYLSQDGFKHLLEQKCDLACTDRPIGTLEREQPGTDQLRGVRVAYYGYALYVNEANPLESAFGAHLGLIFKKSVTDWKQLGSTVEGPIHLYGPRKATRGGEVLMRTTNVVYDAAPWQIFDTDAEIVAAVRKDPLGLGFAALGYDRDGVRYLGLRMERKETPVLPARETLEQDRYGLGKVIYVYYRDPPSEAVTALLDFLFSPAGAKAMSSAGCWQIPRERAGAPGGS